MLTEKMKQVVDAGWKKAWDAEYVVPLEAVYAAVEAALAEQARAAEQPTQPPAGDVVERMLHTYAVVSGFAGNTEQCQLDGMAAALAIAREGYVKLDTCTGCRHTRIAHCNLHDDKWACSECLCKNYMPLIPEGYVSLDAVEAAIIDQTQMADQMWRGSVDFAARVRARLAKPAERTVIVDCDAVDQWYVALDRTPLNVKFTNKRDAERYATGLREELRDGKEGK